LIDSNKFSSFAISIVQTLQENNFEAYLVGGCIRDALTNITPKDFDIATNATPEEVRKLFKASRIIGKRFKLVHVFNRSELIEVATFRAGKIKNNSDSLIKDDNGKILRDNTWGTIQQDCHRRDFTVNALYYCPISKKIQDFHAGLKHINKKILVSIGDPQGRFEEDPVRALRAVRFSSKLDFKIDNKVKDAIYDKGYLLSSVSNARLFDEFCKIFLNGHAEKNFNKLDSFGLAKYLISTDHTYSNFSKEVISQALKNTDKRIKNKQSITPGFLMAALLWPKLIQKCSKNNELNIRKFFRSMDGILRDQHQLTAIPRKFQSYIKDIWVLQLKLDSRLGKYPHKLVKHPRFRAAYDFLLIRESAANEDYQIGDWWTKFQKQNYDERETALTKLRNQRDNESDKKFGFLGELI
tara:strand:- start:534 stop:1766 length:1233 start_codon:yes stop_codon:yes gene_type:complete